MSQDVQFNFIIWICFRKNSTIIYELWFFFKIIAFLRVYFNFSANFKFIIFACILQFSNVMYDRTFISITTAFIKFSKNFKQRISCYNFNLSKVQRQRISCYDFNFLKIQQQRIFLMICFSIHNFLTLFDLIIYLLIFVLHMLINSRIHMIQFKMQFYSSTYLSWQLLDSFMYISLLILNKFEL